MDQALNQTYGYPGLLKWLCLPTLALSPLFIQLDYERGFISDGFDVFLWLCILLFHVLGLLYFNRTKVIVGKSAIIRKGMFGQARIYFRDVREIRIRAGGKPNYLTTTISSSKKSIKFDSFMAGYHELNKTMSERCSNAQKMFE